MVTDQWAPATCSAWEAPFWKCGKPRCLPLPPTFPKSSDRPPLWALSSPVSTSQLSALEGGAQWSLLTCPPPGGLPQPPSGL